MGKLTKNLSLLHAALGNYHYTLVAISKTKPNSAILEAYNAGQRHFGENKVQELTDKYDALPKDIHWHMVGHLQRNKVKFVVPFVHLIHSVDSLRLLREINKEAAKINRVVDCLLQVHIAEEDTKFGFDEKELDDLLAGDAPRELPFVRIRGLMGMATFTEDEQQIRREFSGLKKLFDRLSKQYRGKNIAWKELSMGMSGDYQLALECGSTMIRVGSAIFGERNYA